MDREELLRLVDAGDMDRLAEAALRGIADRLHPGWKRITVVVADEGHDLIGQRVIRRWACQAAEAVR